VLAMRIAYRIVGVWEGGGAGGVGVAEVGLVEGAVGVEGDIEAAGGLEGGEEFFVHLEGDGFVGGGLDEVLHLEAVGLEVVEFVEVPEALVADVLIAIAAEGVDGGGLGEVAFPIVFVEEAVAPGDLPALGKGEEAAALDGRGGSEAGGIEAGGGDVDVGDDLVEFFAAAEELGALQEQGDAHRFLVGGAFVDEAVFAEGEAVVAHIDDEGGIELVFGLEPGHDAAEGVVDGAEGFGVADRE